MSAKLIDLNKKIQEAKIRAIYKNIVSVRNKVFNEGTRLNQLAKDLNAAEAELRFIAKIYNINIDLR